MQESQQEIINAETYFTAEDIGRWAKALLKAVRIKEKLKKRGEYRKRWNKETVRRLSTIAKELWESEEKSKVIDVIYCQDGRTVKELSLIHI